MTTTSLLRRASALLVLPVVAACGGDSTGPGPSRLEAFVAAGDAQFGAPGESLAAALHIIVINAVSGRPAREVSVEWRLVAGSGAALSPARSTTDEHGVTSTSLRLGGDTGTYRVEAIVPGVVGAPPAFTARAVLAPEILSIEPSAAAAGETVTIDGRNFSASPDENTVLFGGLRGTVRTASATRLIVEVPPCVPDRRLELRVALGAIAGDPVEFDATSAGAPLLTLGPGEARTFTSAGDLACLKLARELGSTHLLIAQNAAQRATLPMPYELRGILNGGIVTAAPRTRAAPARASAFSPGAWEWRLRERELAFAGPGAVSPVVPQAGQVVVQPEIGDRREFNVLNSANEPVRITAEVRAISERAIMYQDLEAPANGFTAADFAAFGSIFDDPIYPTDVEVFGEPSDVDANGRIIILFTPRINALTPRDEDGFIAGYFYGCDLVEATRCSATNRGEIFYSMVPDPQGTFSGARTRTLVLRTVPGVLAHEFQHMIGFARKNQSLDALWLSEGLAHAAEEIVGDVLLQRGDTARAADFKLPNFVRAHRYLGDVAATSMLADAAPGGLEQRGAAWLFVEYIAGHYGGHELLRRLTGSLNTSVANVTAETGQAWSALLSHFAVALWADDAPEFDGIDLDPRLRFQDFDMRRLLGQFQGGFALQPRAQTFTDFLIADDIGAGAQEYLLLNAGAFHEPPIHIALSGPFGGAFSGLGLTPQLVLLRVR